MSNKIFKLLLITIIATSLSGCIFDKSEEKVSQEQEVVKASPDFSNDVVPVIEVPAEPEKIESIVIVADADDINAFDLLQRNAEINYKMYDFGLMISDINGIASSEDYFWALYINGEKAQKGADQTFMKEGDEMEWRYEEIVY